MWLIDKCINPVKRKIDSLRRKLKSMTPTIFAISGAAATVAGTWFLDTHSNSTVAGIFGVTFTFLATSPFYLSLNQRIYANRIITKKVDADSLWSRTTDILGFGALIVYAALAIKNKDAASKFQLSTLTFSTLLPPSIDFIHMLYSKAKYNTASRLQVAVIEHLDNYLQRNSSEEEFQHFLGSAASQAFFADFDLEPYAQILNAWNQVQTLIHSNAEELQVNDDDDFESHRTSTSSRSSRTTSSSTTMRADSRY